MYRHHSTALQPVVRWAAMVVLVASIPTGTAQDFTPVTRLQFDVAVQMPDPTERTDQAACEKRYVAGRRKELASLAPADTNLLGFGCYVIVQEPSTALHAFTSSMEQADWHLKVETPHVAEFDLAQMYLHGTKAIHAFWQFSDKAPRAAVLFVVLYGPGQD